MVTWACNCGAVSFEVIGELTDIFVCHCSICRRYTGSNGIAVVLCPIEAFRWLGDDEKRASWSKPDADWQSSFCSNCGSTLPVKDSERSMAIPAGLISTSPKAMRVAHHIWVESKAEWDIIGDNGKQHSEAFMA